jgi:hypothetical protein
MIFIPNRKLGLFLGVAFLLILLSATVFGIFQLATATMSARIILWVLLPIIGVPLSFLVSYRIYGLITARYRLDREGFYLTWGLAYEQIPIAEIQSVELASITYENLAPEFTFRWPGCVVGHLDVDHDAAIEFFSTQTTGEMVLLVSNERTLAISPPDPEGFQKYFVDTVRMGSLDEIPAISQRPDFILARMWNDFRARILVLSGIVISLLLFGYLALRASSLPPSVPFGFDPMGNPDPYAPPGRLLLLPMIGVFCWFLDLLTGVWVYRRNEDHPLAYAIWSTAIIVGGLLWGATLHLLAVV